MGDMISRDAAIGALEDRRDKYQKDSQTWLQIQMDILAIRAIPAADARPVQDDAASRRRKIMGHMDDRAAADARAEALLEAAEMIDKRHRGDLPDHIKSEDGNAIRAMIKTKTCPPCHGDCNQGRTCPARKK